VKRKPTRWAAVLATALLGCGEPDRAADADVAARSAATPPDPAGTIDTPAPPIAEEYRVGSADPCALLREADPQKLLDTEVGAPWRVYGLCRFEARVWPRDEPERAIGLEMRPDTERGVAHDLDEFWEREGAGVDLLGGRREQIEEIPGLGDYALWVPTDRGLQLYAYWEDRYILVLTIAGAPREQALPWARALAANAIRTAQQPAS
jgi:hypothetical protein